MTRAHLTTGSIHALFYLSAGIMSVLRTLLDFFLGTGAIGKKKKKSVNLFCLLYTIAQRTMLIFSNVKLSQHQNSLFIKESSFRRISFRMMRI